MLALSRRRFLALLAPASAALVGCQNGFRIFGYQAGADALYDPNIRTVFVPIFNNRAFQTNPYKGFEVDVTQAVVREIGKTTSYRVTSDLGRADTELLGNIAIIQKQLLNLNQLNQIREAEIQVTVDVVWRDLRDGTILSNPRKARRPGAPNPQTEDPLPFDPTVPLVPDLSDPAIPTPQRVVATGRLIPELGESNATASKRIHDQIAVQIVSMMERRW